MKGLNGVVIMLIIIVVALFLLYNSGYIMKKCTTSEQVGVVLRCAFLPGQENLSRGWTEMCGMLAKVQAGILCGGNVTNDFEVTTS